MTFPIEKLVFFDFETRASTVSLQKAGTYRYAEAADAIILTYAIGNQPVRIVQKRGRALEWLDLPGEFRAAYDASDTYFVAWNAGFDRAIWNYAVADSPFLEPRRVLDAMAQAMASNLPPALDMASTATGGPGKQPDGKKLIALFCGKDAADPKDFTAEWDRFNQYAARDVAVTRNVWKHTRPLTFVEWRTYWANEAICERGIGIDLEFCQAASKLAIEDGTRAGRRLAVLTKGAVTTVYQHIRLAEWIWDRLPSDEARDIMVTALIELDEREDEEDDSRTVDGVRSEISIKRGVVERLIDWMESSGHRDSVLREVLELREFGASAAPKKYAAALAQNTGGRLRGQIVFNGAAQTGRFSGKGVQPQNLTRTPLGGDYGTWEPGAVDMITDGCTLEDLAAFGDREVPSRKLALLVRPAIVAPPGKTLIKADYEQVEARCLPWLAKSPSAEKLLEYFRAVDADPTLPDLYVISAAGMLRKRPQEVTKQERQTGKVAVLACGYGGGQRALAAMAASYRLYIPPDEAQEIVDKWRAANPWAPSFWGRHSSGQSFGLWGAVMRSYNDPQSVQTAGRIAFIFEPAYLGGTLFMRLPSGRLLTYPWCKWREYEIKDKITGKVKEIRKGLTFRRPGGMRALYGGLLAENATQATCADLLRESLVILEEGLLGARLDVVLHAHDEIVAECPDNPAEIRRSLELLESAMTLDRAWAQGFPLAVDSVVRFYYSAAKLKEAA
jgi:DNA polymerase bacteriophage-type